MSQPAQVAPVQAQQKSVPAHASAAGLLQRKCACGQHTIAGGECEECRRKREGMLQRAAINAVPANGVPPIVHDVLNSLGQPLDSGTRAFMEPRFGFDFSQVRVHTDARAAESAQAVNALAYTVGRNVVFGVGQYAPRASEGKRLLAHELTHVVQQNGLVRDPQAKLAMSTSENPDEREAELVEQAINTPGRTLRMPTQLPSALIQRRVVPGNVSCHEHGLTNPNLTGAEAVAAIQAADKEAIRLAAGAENSLFLNLVLTEAHEPVDASFDAILQEELGLTLTNPAHFRLIDQQRDRFRRVRELLESGYLRYMCRGDTATGSMNLIGCGPDQCGGPGDYAFSCQANRLIVLCQEFWGTPNERPGTILHEPFHILFSMAHRASVPRRSDADCFEAFASRLAGRVSEASCKNRTAG